MSLINHSIPSMFNGVSQQPAPLRHSSQCELQENAYPSVASGLRKRPPSIHLAKLRNSPLGDAYSYTINRDTNERYAVLVSNGSIEVFNLVTGQPCSVSYPNGTGYLNHASPSTGFALTTVADYTFVINKSKVVARSAVAAPLNPVNVAYVYVAAAPAQHKFSVILDGKPAFMTELGTSGGSQGGVAFALLQLIAADTAYTVTRIGESVLKIVKVDGSQLVMQTSDTYGDQAMKAISNGAARFSDLPSKMDPGFTFKMFGDPSNNEDTYFVEYKNGGWVEAVEPGSINAFDVNTMPHQLVRTGINQFTFQTAAWNPRKVGNDDSNPAPSFVGRTIADIFFFRNRLGFVSDENVILSESGKFFNFYAQTVRSVIDSDPIDVSMPGTKVSVLRYAVPFNKVLLLFSDQTQFQLSSGDTFTAKTVRVDVSTSFESSSLCRPEAVGQEIFFPVIRGKYTAIREYYVDNNNVSNDAVEVTAHVDHYIPSGVFKLASSSNEDVLVGLSTEERNALFVYKFYWSKNEKMQSAWCKMTLGAGDVILNADFIANKLYLVVQRSDGVFLEMMDFQSDLEDDGMGYLVGLDRRVAVQGTYDPVADLTTWTAPYGFSEAPVVVLGPAFAGQKGALVTPQFVSGSSLQVYGNYTAGTVFIGYRYVMRYRFSEQYIVDEKGTALLSARVKIRRMFLNYSKSGYFRVEVTPKARGTYTYVMNGKVAGHVAMVLGSQALESGTFSVPVQTSNIGVTIDIINDSHFPSTFQSAEWEGEFSIHSSRH